MMIFLSLLLSFFLFLPQIFSESLEDLFLGLKKEHDSATKEKTPLPLTYNTSLMTGYLNMPSARCHEVGTSAIGYAYFPPYQNYGLNFQIFGALEAALNYRVFTGKAEENFGKYGFGDDADRTANLKLFFDFENLVSSYLPNLAAGVDDFYGSKRFFSPYVVMTKTFQKQGFELSLGYGLGRVKGLFGALAYSPFFKSTIKSLSGLTFLLEYDATDYAHHHDEHPSGREVNSPFNIGLNIGLLNFLDFKIFTLRGKTLALQGDLHYNFGKTTGLFPKYQDPKEYEFPKNFEEIGQLREKKEVAFEISNALLKQGFYVTHVYLKTNESGGNVLHINLINLRYWRNREVKARIVSVLKNLIPDNVDSIDVTIQESSIPVETYVFSKALLKELDENKIEGEAFDEKTPALEAFKNPDIYEGTLLFYRKKTVASWLVRPRLLSFFGSTTGKYKYALSLIGGPQGYIFDTLYYKILLSYNIKSSIQNLSDIDYYDPSQLPCVRSDSVRYFQSNTVQLEQAYLQQGVNLGKGFYFRAAGGYFEPAYGGLAVEGLYYPVGSNFAIGLEAATVLKRNYTGLGFTTKIRKLNGKTPEYEPFVGVQYFLDYYYNFKPIQVEFKLSIGQFLAKDKGARFELARYYPSGLRVGIWTTVTNANDQVHGKVYYDKGISFRMPLDIFLTKSSRNSIGYGLALWLRDQGAKAMTGKELYPILYRAREY